MTRWIVTAFCLAACHHEAAPPAAPIAKPSTCEQVADHVIGLMSAAQKAKPEELDPFRNVVSKRCAEDHWSAEAQRCLVGIATLAEGDRCEKLLTEAQAKALAHDGQAAASVAPAPAQPPQNAPKSFQRTQKAKSDSPGAASDPCEGGE